MEGGGDGDESSEDKTVKEDKGGGDQNPDGNEDTPKKGDKAGRDGNEGTTDEDASPIQVTPTDDDGSMASSRADINIKDRRSTSTHISATFLPHSEFNKKFEQVKLIPGGLSVSTDFLFFEPDPRFRESVKITSKKTDPEHWMIYVDMIDIMEAGAVTMPAADNGAGVEFSGSANFFLQINLHPRKQFKTGVESQLLLFKLGSKDVLYEVTRQIIGMIGAIKQSHTPRSLEAEREKTSTTNVAFESPSVEDLLGINDKVEFRHSAAIAGPFEASRPSGGRDILRKYSDIGGYDMKGHIEEHDPNAESDILTPEIADQLSSILPLSVRFSPWLLAYSPKKHGVSIQSFYRNLADRGPSLVCVRDSNGKIFGGYASESWAPLNKYYGTGESFVFTLIGDDVKIYPWAARNVFIQYGDDKMIAMGGGGESALVINGSFLRGSSQKCTTFLNERLSSEDDFVIRDLEFWTFEEV